MCKGEKIGNIRTLKSLFVSFYTPTSFAQPSATPRMSSGRGFSKACAVVVCGRPPTVAGSVPRRLSSYNQHSAAVEFLSQRAFFCSKTEPLKSNAQDACFMLLVCPSHVQWCSCCCEKERRVERSGTKAPFVCDPLRLPLSAFLCLCSAQQVKWITHQTTGSSSITCVCEHGDGCFR